MCLLHNNSWSVSWLGWSWWCSCHCLVHLKFCWVRHMRMLSGHLHCIICNMIYTSALFSRCISKIPCHCIPPCLSGKCGFCKFCEVHSFPKLTRYLLKNINTWFWNLIKYLFVYLLIFICFSDVKGRWKNLLFIFLCFRWPTFIYN